MTSRPGTIRAILADLLGLAAVVALAGSPWIVRALL